MQTVLDSPLGKLVLTGDGSAITGLTLGGPLPETAEVSPLFDALGLWLDRYWSGRDPGPLPVPLQPEGTPFQREVCDLLLKIPYGKSVTYGELAAQLALHRGISRMSSQAVGQAVSRNPIAILIPCHRVLGSGNRLTGYAYGLPAKEYLLNLESIPWNP